MSRLLTDAEITRQLRRLPDWSRDGGTLRASYQAPDFLAGIRLVQEVALLAEAMDHHPDIDIRSRTVPSRCRPTPRAGSHSSTSSSRTRSRRKRAGSGRHRPSERDRPMT